MQETIKTNIECIRERIAKAAQRAGRDPESITLIAVSKLHSAAEVEAAAACGIKDFGENKVQELLQKQPLVTAPANWHLIGHLQTNKVRQIVGKTVLIHSVDSLHLAEEIDKRSAAAGTVSDILVQVNAAHEESKFGVSPNEAKKLVHTICENLKNLRVRGLMQIAPFAEDPEDIRVYFTQTASLFEKLKSEGLGSFDTLSMGMSHDFETAIEEGATHVRIGTAIFGERDYSKKIII